MALQTVQQWSEQGLLSVVERVASQVVQKRSGWARVHLVVVKDACMAS